jgi:hypothetical protein
LEAGRQQKKEEMIKVFLFNQHDTHFATFDMPELPRAGDFINLEFPNDQVGKSFTVERVVHQMVYNENPVYHTEETPWHWEFRLYGELNDPYVEGLPCICAQGISICPKHGEQPAERDICPQCEKAVLGYCAQGVYCTSDDCNYTS